MQNELVTIAFSHYCEKARWALDRFRVPYRERAYLPAFHLPAVMRRALPAGAGKKDRASSRFSTPLLRTSEGELLTDSSDILAWVDARYAGGVLYASPEAKALERELGEELGPHARRFAYFHLLPERELLLEAADRNVSKPQALLFKLLAPGMSPLLRRNLRLTAESAARSLEKVRRVVDRVDARVKDGRPYLTGDAFGAADLTFAALLAPLVAPPEYGAWLPGLDRVPPALRAVADELRARPSGELALRLYREERRKPA